MPVEIIMPKVDMDMAQGTIAAWHVEEGQTIQKGEPLFEIETDKATMEIESPASGAVHFISAHSGDIIEIGKTIGWLFEAGETIKNPSLHANETGQNTARTTETPKSADADTKSDPQDETHGLTDVTLAENKVRATPLARRLAKTKNIDITKVVGSGPRGRITRADVENHAQPAEISSAKPGITPTSPRPSMDAPMASKTQLDALGIAYETQPADRMRQTIAARLTASKTTVPHFYLELDCQLDNLLTFRQQANQSLDKIGGKKISINDMLVRACAQALMAVPEANASWAGEEILHYKDANISVAVAIEGGLITPVVRQAQTKSLNKISEEIADLAQRAKSGKLKPHEYQGGSFSISNLGMFGVKAFSAIINPPESMILAVGKAERRFIEDDNGNPVGATLLSVTLSCDHRVVDGALGARWLSSFKNFIENPVLLIMDLV